MSKKNEKETDVGYVVGHGLEKDISKHIGLFINEILVYFYTCQLI